MAEFYNNVYFRYDERHDRTFRPTVTIYMRYMYTGMIKQDSEGKELFA